MHRIIANTLSELRTEWASWRSICNFLVHLNDMDFYKEVDEQREMRIAPWASCREGLHGKQTWPIECVGVTYEMKVTELIAGIQADKVTMWVERGSLRYRGLSRRSKSGCRRYRTTEKRSRPNCDTVRPPR